MSNHPTIQDYILAEGISAKIIDLGVPMETAAIAAENLQIPVGSIFKSIVLIDDHGQAIVAVLEGDKKVNLKQLAKIAGTRNLRFAKPDVVLRVTGYPAGGTPPIGHKEKLSVFVDRGLMAYAVGYGGGGFPELLLEIAPEELVRATGATVSDIAL